MKFEQKAFINCTSLNIFNLLKSKTQFALNIFPEFDNTPLDLSVYISDDKNLWINSQTHNFCKKWFIEK
jgi:hypothetical protein